MKKDNVNMKVPTSRKVGLSSKKSEFFRLSGGSNCQEDDQTQSSMSNI